jgi:hypothetical protein
MKAYGNWQNLVVEMQPISPAVLWYVVVCGKEEMFYNLFQRKFWIIVLIKTNIIRPGKWLQDYGTSRKATLFATNDDKKGAWRKFWSSIIQLTAPDFITGGGYFPTPPPPCLAADVSSGERATVPWTYSTGVPKTDVTFQAHLYDFQSSTIGLENHSLLGWSAV